MRIGCSRPPGNQVTVDGLNGNELSGTQRFSSAINLDAIDRLLREIDRSRD